jgi:ATP-binding cassette, subfamily B, bacterial
VLRHTATLDLGRLVDPTFQHLKQMVSRRGQGAIHSLWDAQLEIAGALISVVLGCAVLVTLEPVLGLLATALALPSILHRWKQQEKRRRLDESETVARRSMRVVRDALQSPDEAVTSRTLDHTELFLVRYTLLKRRLLENMLAMASFDRMWSIGIGLLSLVGTLVFGLYFAKGFIEGSYTLVVLGAIFGSVQMVTSAIRQLGWAISSLADERKDYTYLLDFFATQPLVPTTACAGITLRATPEIVLEDVSFTYPGASAQALTAISTTIRPGEKVAFVGPNGCGKTTLTRLIGRVYVPTSGTVWLDAYASNEASQESWLRHVTMLPQASSLPAMEVSRAITGCEPGTELKDRLGTALTFAGLADVVAALPHGLRTFIGEEWPEGRGFSTGERQRLALAAVLYRLLDPGVYIALCDEPTANCDARTKTQFYSSIHLAPEFRTKTVIVSLHDPLYLNHFDRVIVFDNGTIVDNICGAERVEAYKSTLALALARDL